jgi:hypothetical protein
LKPKDRDFIETKEGLLFCVVGYLHPPDRVTAYLKYIPSVDGKWSRGEIHYDRTLQFYNVAQVENTYNYLKKTYPDYIFNDPVRNITLSAVPKNKIKQYYKPKERLLEILEKPGDALEEKVCEIIEKIAKYVNIEGSIGITGSVLTGSHNPNFSDLDFTVYGFKNIVDLKKSILSLKSEGEMRSLSVKELENWCQERSRKFPLSVAELRRVAFKRWNFGYYKNTYISFHATRNDKEISEEYGDNIYTQIGEARGTGTISDISESMYNPAVYEIEDSQLEDTKRNVSKIISFESLYGSLFEVEDKIEFKGKLEKVEGKKKGYRVVLGGAGSTDSFVKWSTPQD